MPKALGCKRVYDDRIAGVTFEENASRNALIVNEEYAWVENPFSALRRRVIIKGLSLAFLFYRFLSSLRKNVANSPREKAIGPHGKEANDLAGKEAIRPNGKAANSPAGKAPISPHGKETNSLAGKAAISPHKNASNGPAGTKTRGLTSYLPNFYV
ncbi:hypothetical protein [Alistipes sp.]|uniref:hypothetical protein n=1 Tax=Alistipes sp. TaxID=1872444 RepID=UPI0025C2F0DC|nr:hypothetical protein [Alistipes sp.]